MTKMQEAHDRGARRCGARHRLDRGQQRRRRRAAAIGGGFHGGLPRRRQALRRRHHYGHRFTTTHRHRHFGYGYAYNTCWKYTPYGLVNVCTRVPY